MATNLAVPGAAEEPDDDSQPSRALPPAPSATKGGFFAIYKKGQGKWTRLGTAGVAALLGALTAYNFVQYLPTWGVSKNIAIISATVFLAAFAGLIFYLVNKPKHVDFLIATDSEMKKVNWTTGNELWGSTRVVIGFVVFLAVALFVIDLVFAYFFHLIGVLQTSTAS